MTTINIDISLEQLTLLTKLTTAGLDHPEAASIFTSEERDEAMLLNGMITDTADTVRDDPAQADDCTFGFDK